MHRLVHVFAAHIPKKYQKELFSAYGINRGSYMCAHVLLNLSNELRKSDKMRGLPNILLLFPNQFNKFNNTGA